MKFLLEVFLHVSVSQKLVKRFAYLQKEWADLEKETIEAAASVDNLAEAISVAK